MSETQVWNNWNYNTPPVAGATLTDRGWEIPLAGSADGLMEVIVAMGGKSSGTESGAAEVQSISYNALAYLTDDVLSIECVFNENVTVTGTPRIAVTIGSNTRQANYASGSGTNKLIFSYTIVSGDFSKVGDVSVASSISLNSGTLKDGGDTAVTLTLSSATGYASGAAVGVNKPSVQTTAKNAASYVTGDHFDITVTYNELITVTGTPRITLAIGSNTRYATYLSGSGTTALVFRYDIVAGDSATSGNVAVGNSGAIGLNSGTMKSPVGIDANLQLTSITGISSVTVN